MIGAGQYTDNDIGAAGSTGRGEANIMVCGAFLTVDNMRRGMSPTDAALETLRRVVATTEPRLLNERGRPTFNLNFYAVNKNGEFGAGTIWSGGRYAAYDGMTAELRAAIRARKPATQCRILEPPTTDCGQQNDCRRFLVRDSQRLLNNAGFV